MNTATSRGARKAAQALLKGVPGTHYTKAQQIERLTAARDLLDQAILLATSEPDKTPEQLEQAKVDAEFGALAHALGVTTADEPVDLVGDSLKQAALEATGAEDITFEDDEDETDFIS